MLEYCAYKREHATQTYTACLYAYMQEFAWSARGILDTPSDRPAVTLVITLKRTAAALYILYVQEHE